MPRTTTRLVALGAAAVAVAIAATPAAARSTLVDDDAAILTRAAAAGLQPEGDNLYQATGAVPVFGTSREVASVPASALLGRSAPGMATVLRDTLAKAGGHYAIVDDAGTAFRGSAGDTLAAALGLLGAQTAPYPGGGPLARRVHLYVSPAAGALLTDPALRGLRTALARSGGLWLKTSGWTPLQWLTWPAETARQVSARGLARSRVHVALPGGDQAALWARARNGSACVTLSNGPGAYRVGGSIEAFAAQYRRAFTFPASSKTAPGCTAAPLLPRSGASALVSAAGRETTGLVIPPGGLVTPPLVAGEPAQVTLQLGDDPLGLAAGLGVPAEALWKALDVVVQVRGPGVALDATIGGDGSAALEFTPTAPGPVTMRIVIRGAGVSTALGGPSDLVEPLAATAGSAALLDARRRVAGRLGARHPPGPRRRLARRPRPGDRPALRLSRRLSARLSARRPPWCAGPPGSGARGSRRGCCAT